VCGKRYARREGKGRKVFFFEKKKQKTFVTLQSQLGLLERNQIDKSFLLLFFKKEDLSSFLPARHAAAWGERLPPGLLKLIVVTIVGARALCLQEPQ
jgi:hypothetical protein